MLFDVGYSHAYIRNAEKLGINLRKLDYVILSHGHNDHTWGLESLIRLYSEAKLEGLDYRKPLVVGHPGVLHSKFYQGEQIGSLLSEDKLSQHFGLRYSKEPLWLTERLVYLGEIERHNRFEGEPIGEMIGSDGMVDDFIHDDSALVYKSEEGLVVIVACSHSGICNTIEYAKKVCKEERILEVIGGFHLQQPSKEQLEGTVDYFQKVMPGAVHACHCTDLHSKIALSKAVNITEVGVGLQLQF